MRVPKDDNWRKVTLAKMELDGMRLWLHCQCGHGVVVEPSELAQRHHLAPETPLLIIGHALRCTRCGKQTGQCWPEPYGISSRKSP